jgi:lipooligosaccharide transport system permease protein
MSAGAPPPAPAAGIAAVWLRHAAVWSRSWRTSLVGTLGEPLFYFLGLGYGLATLIPEAGGLPYLSFVAPGLMLSSLMYSATVESTYMTFSKMEHQKVYAGMILSPLTFAEIVGGEILWAATKGLMSGAAVLALCLLFGVARPWPGLLCLLVLALGGLTFAALGLIVTSAARGYDSFNYYFTFVVAPMFFFSGIFYPVEKLGEWVARIAWLFPLTHLVRLSRALALGRFEPPLWGDLAWVTVFAAIALFAAVRLMARRFHP